MKEQLATREELQRLTKLTARIEICVLALALLGCDRVKTRESRVEPGDLASRSRQLAAYPFSEPAKKAVEKLLAESGQWRLALTADNENKELQNYLSENLGYTPYFAAADMNGDGLTDLAVALIRDGAFAVVWLRGDKTGFGSPQWLTKNGRLNQGGLFPKRDGLLVGNLFDCDNAEYFRWEPAHQQLILVNDSS